MNDAIQFSNAIDWENDLVVVVRLMRNDALNEFLGKVIGSLRPRPTA